MPRIGLPPRRSVSSKDVSDLRLWPGHSSRALLHPSSQGLVLQQLDLLIGTDGAADRLGGHMGITRSGRQLGVDEKHLNDPHVRVRLQQMGREAVAERVQRCRFLYARHVLGRGERPVQLAWRQRIDLGFAREQPSLRTGFAPVVA